MPKFRKKPVVIDAIQFTGQNHIDIFKWVDQFDPEDDGPAMEEGENETLLISTLEGEMTASKGDYIIRGVQGEYYPCKPDIFKKTYDEVKQTPPDSEIFKRTNYDELRDEANGY